MTIVNIHLQDGENTHYCEANRETALQMAPLMFHHHVRVYGIGKYFRDMDGNWGMRNFRISHFEELDARPLDNSAHFGPWNYRNRVQDQDGPCGPA